MKNIKNEIVPMVEENEGNINKTWDLYSKLLKDRIVMLNNEVSNVTSSLICAELLYLNSQDNKSPIEFYINSPGGSVTDGIAIYETMRRIQAPVYTICLGSAASMGAFLLAMGEKGHRYCGKYSEVMIHQVLGGFNGQSTDINIHAKHINDLKIKLTYLLAESTQGKTTAETMWNLCERDNFLTPEKALEIGLIDKII